MSKNSVKKRSGSAKVDPNLATRDGLLLLVDNPNFWNYLRNDFVQLGCACHSQGAQMIAGDGSQQKLEAARKEIVESISGIFESDFALQRSASKLPLLDVYAMNLMLDQSHRDAGYISKRTKNFCEKFAIKGTLSGVEIAGEIFSDFDPRKHLRKRFNLDENFQQRREAIWNLQESVFERSLKIADIGFRDFIAEPASRAAQIAYRNTPSLPTIALTLGTAQMIMRAADYQNSADNLRDNIGATTEMAAFFILANGILENLSHSLILAAPAYVATGFYDSLYRAIRGEQTRQNLPTQTHHEDPQFNPIGVSRTYNDEITALQKMQEYLQQDQLWEGLRKRQLAYQDNQIELQLKQSCADLISKLQSQKPFGDYYITKEYVQSLADMSLLLNSYREVYDKNGEDFSIKSDLENFAEVFSLYGVLLKEPSKDAVAAEFCLRAHHQMVNFDERISASLPHMPSGRQVLLAASVIAAIYSAKEIYSAITGEEETATDYVTNFPDHLFSWLQLGQMYENLGGDSTLSESFRDFFSSFNFVENSTHLGIAVAPFFAYQQFGSKIFDDVMHQAGNFKAYLQHSADHYFQQLSSIFDKSRSKVYDNLEANEESDQRDLERGIELVDQEELEKKNALVLGSQTDARVPNQSTFSRMVSTLVGQVPSLTK